MQIESFSIWKKKKHHPSSMSGRKQPTQDELIGIFIDFCLILLCLYVSFVLLVFCLYIWGFDLVTCGFDHVCVSPLFA